MKDDHHVAGTSTRCRFALSSNRWALATGSSSVRRGDATAPIGLVVEMIERRNMRAGWQQFAAPAVILAIGPAGIIPALFVAPGLFVFVAAQVPSSEASKPLPAVIGVIVRAVWLAIAVAGVLALIGDIRAINRLD